MLLEADRSLSVVVDLKIGAGVWRDEVSEWQPWVSSQDQADALND
jgi:hypothetical protein